MAIGRGKKKKRGGFKRQLLTGTLLLLVFYFGAHAIVRTKGFRKYVADKIANFTHQPVSLKECSASPLLGLELKGLAFYGVVMPSVTIKWNWAAFLSEKEPFIRKVVIRGMQVKFRRIPVSGKWDPLVLHDLANPLGAALGLKYLPLKADSSLPRLPEILFNKKTAVEIDRANIMWRDVNGKEQARVNDINLSAEVVPFTGRDAIQFLMKAKELQMASGRLIRDVELEIIKIDGFDPVLVFRLASRDREYDSFESDNLWIDLYSRLNLLAK